MKELSVGIVACDSMCTQIRECLASLEGSFCIYPITPSCTFSVKIDLLRHYLDRSTAENDVTLLAYGMCHPQLLALLAEYHDRVVRVEGYNCYEMFLGSEKYAEYHPGGELGRKLLKVEEVMRSLDECVHVGADTEVGEVLKRITDSPGRAGAVCIVDDSGVLIGIFTDGDLRRRILKGESFLRKPVSDVMTTHPKRIRIGSLAYEAAKILKDYKIDELPVEDADGRLRGIIDIQDLLAVRVIAP